VELRVEFRLVGTGWAECVISDEAASATVTASYLSDALRYLVLAGTAALSSFAALTFHFDEEPGEFRWVVRAPRMNEIELVILEFPQLWGERPDSEGTEVFRTKCRPVIFARAIHEAAGALLKSIGEAGYAEKWAEHPFPTLQFQELGRLLKRAQAHEAQLLR
jgi:hypothetical protein